MNDNQLTSQGEEPVDLTNCDREPIHLLGAVQGYGCLIATSHDFMIGHISQNAKDVLGLDPEIVVGHRLIDFLPGKTVHDLRTKLQLVSSGAGASRLFGVDAMQDGRLFDVSVHMSDRFYVFEFEPKPDGDDRDEMSMVQPLLTRVKTTDSVLDAAKEAARAISALSGFDRVMVYQFSHDGSGEVIAEKCAPQMEPFLGLRYPASDIPQQARELYKKSLLRLIADVDGEVSPVVSASRTTRSNLDLSLAVTRAVSPIHLEYLRNMGVAASMSVSIVKDGELWGLFACHHRTPRYIDYERRTAIELFAQFFSYELIRKSDQALRDEERRARKLHDHLMMRLSSGDDLHDGFEVIADELSGIVSSDGIAVYSDGRFTSRGSTPTREEFLPLTRLLNTAPSGQIFTTDRLGSVFPPSQTFQDRVAGLMAVPISRTPRDYIVFFRREIVRSVQWAGNPEKPVELGPNGTRLTPRKSFDAWKEIVRGTCAVWTDSEKHAGEALRISLIEVVLKLTDEANIERRKASQKQELLIAELNHRVRNILNLIQGLVSQSRDGARDVAAYTRVLDDRIQALARAHDQLTRREWSAIPLHELIDVEVKAFLNDQSGRVRVHGDFPLLSAEAFSTMALVIHELVTNSVKYGALTDRSGTVAVGLKIADDGSLFIEWKESGGPPVQAPTRRGFGTTIIESTIPFELKGTVDTRYLLSGFQADIMIPSPFIESGEGPSPGEVEPNTKSPDRSGEISGDVLVVEDNMIIALDSSETLRNSGATEAHMASSVEDALSLLEGTSITFALLDVNLRDQTSLPVAEELARRNIPFVLATGYGDTAEIVRSYPPCPVLKKPFTAEALLQAVGQAVNSPR